MPCAAALSNTACCSCAGSAEARTRLSGAGRSAVLEIETALSGDFPGKNVVRPYSALTRQGGIFLRRYISSPTITAPNTTLSMT
jgi:hypothetical protein